jgi:arylsulfatase A-like enzyme
MNVDNIGREQPNAVDSNNKKAAFVVFLLGVLLVVTCLLLIFLPQKEKNTNEEKKRSFPNIVLIVMDAFRADRIGANRNGIPLTPFLNQLTEKSVYFKNAITPCTWTRPAMTSLFTSLHVDTHQVYYGLSSFEEDLPFSDILPDNLQTLSTYLKNLGYKTLAVQTNGQISADFGYDRGFDSYVFMDAPPGEMATAQALSLISGDKSPFFLYTHYMDPHIPYNPPQQYLDMVGYNTDNISDTEKTITEDFSTYFWDHLNYIKGRSNARKYELMSDEGKDCIMARYDAEVRYCDDQVRNLVSSIKKDYPETLFIITADHGEHFWDHDYLGHGLTMYNCELRVPLFIMADFLTPEIIERPVSLVGVLPTVADLLGTEPLSEWQGDTLFKNNVTKPVFSYSRSSSPSSNTDIETVIINGMKYIRDNKKAEGKLFTWPEDISEKKDLSEEMPDVTSKMQQFLLDHRHDNIQARQSKRQQTNIDAETIEQLRRLGYME